MNLKQWSDHLIFRDYAVPPAGLGLYRICYAAFFLIFGIPNFSWIAQNPDAFYAPPFLSLGIFFDGFPSYIVLQSVSLAICILFVMLLFGVFTRTASFLLPALIIFGETFAYSFGKIDHDLMIWLIPWLLGLAGWGNSYSIDCLRKNGKNTTEAWPIAMAALLLGFAFFTAGTAKIMGGWLDWSTQASRFYVMQSELVFNRTTLLGSFSLQLLPDVVWEFADYATVFFEAGFLVAVINKKVFQRFIFAALFFHLFIFLTMGITTSWLYIVYLLFINWPPLLQQLNLKKIRHLLSHRIFISLLAIYVSIFLIGQQVLTHPGITTVSPASIIAKVFSINYYKFFGVTTILAGLLIGIYIYLLTLRRKKI